MTTPILETPPPLEKPALDSLTLRSAAAIAIAVAANRIGIELPPGLAEDAAGALLDLIVTLGLIGVAVGRVRARAAIV
ncbi:MAG: hypothetical protein A4S17_09280 [Proteobacteria bacterium HN_bin10]|jgi:hypothetical protein|nr:MAG: hypothetical protein A4S17_09280 [Proteobacteria bacterium HN_bin10]